MSTIRSVYCMDLKAYNLYIRVPCTHVMYTSYMYNGGCMVLYPVYRSYEENCIVLSSCFSIVTCCGVALHGCQILPTLCLCGSSNPAGGTHPRTDILLSPVSNFIYNYVGCHYHGSTSGCALYLSRGAQMYA